MTLSLKELPDEELFELGSTSCAGCGAALAARLAMKVLGKRTIMVNATGCMTVSYAIPYSPPLFPFIHVLFENTGSVLAGIDAGLKVLGKRIGVTLLGFSGDGGTADIGLQALSGAIERGHRFLYICYDNEAYMNTGGQRSGVTPYGALTATTPLGKKSIGESRPMHLRKEMAKIIAAHGAPYVATASIAYPIDYMNVVKKASEIDGPTYIHVLCPCPPGWGFPENLTIKVARLAVETGMWILYDIENGQFKVRRKIAKRKPVIEYFKLQRRFRHLIENESELQKIQKFIDTRCANMGL
jgi:pyruvate ferredoxin oxidoreductase beta subunit